MQAKTVLKCFTLLVFLSVTSHKGYSADWEVVDSFAGPGTDVTGLTYDGTHLWSASSGNNIIYQINTSGVIQNSFGAPGTSAGGLAYDGSNIWLSDPILLRIYQLDPSDGSTVKQFDAPGEDATGLTFDGTYLWNSDYNWSGSDQYIHKLDTDGNLDHTYISPGSGPQGLAFDGTFLWHADHSMDLIYQLDMQGNVISSFASPASNPMGVTYDGTNLWVSTQSNSMIYKLAPVSEGCKVEQTSWNSSRTSLLNYGQSFTASCDGIINSITVYTHGQDGTGVPAATIEIYNDSTGVVGTPFFNESHPPSPDTGTGLTGHIYLLSNGPEVTSGSTYSIIFNTNGQQWKPIGIDNGNSYSGGDFISNNNSLSDDYDLMFSVDIMNSAQIQFGKNSAALTNKYFSPKKGMKHILVHPADTDGRRQYKYYDAVDIEEVNGVSCLRLIDVDTYNFWFSSYCVAQDLSGDIYVVKVFDTENHDEQTLETPYLYFPANPQVGDTVGGSEEVVEINVTVPELGTGLGPYMDCIKTRQSDGDFVYYAPGLRNVKKESADSLRGYELRETMYIPPGDSNNDSRVGLEDAINALKVVAGD
ncbi:MAG: hypothetical protein GY702_26320 [Desulfobulbaceae bacterium]|nr:hypothetical protein [Desulfobulbaceae bacterium]